MKKTFSVENATLGRPSVEAVAIDVLNNPPVTYNEPGVTFNEPGVFFDDFRVGVKASGEASTASPSFAVETSAVPIGEVNA